MLAFVLVEVALLAIYIVLANKIKRNFEKKIGGSKNEI